MVRKHSDSIKTFSDIITMVEIMIDNIFVMLGGRVFHQTVDIPIGTNCAPLLTDLFLYVADFVPGLLRKNAKKITLSFNFTFRYIDDFLSLNNSKFGVYVDRTYPNDLEIKDNTDTARFASYLDTHLKIDHEGRLRTKNYDKRDDFNFPHCEHSIYM